MTTMREITVGVVAPAYVNVPLWVAQQRGFLAAAEGCAATERILGTTHGVTNALRDGEVDIALSLAGGQHRRRGGRAARSAWWRA